MIWKNIQYMKIKMVDLGSQYKKLKVDIDNAIQSVLDSQQFIGGEEVSNFAKNLSKYNNVKHVIPCGNGTDALQIALMAFNFKQGSEVLLPSFTFVATAESVSILGLKPIFVDINATSFTIDPKKIRQKINKNTVAILPVHLYGQNADMQAIMEIAEENDLKVIEDAAQSIGSEFYFKDGRRAKSGTIGHVGTTSFFPSKNLGAYGDGGAIFTNDDDLAEKCKQIANHGQSKKYYSQRLGMNSRLDAIQAAILNVKLSRLDEFNSKRQERAAKYDILLSKIKGIDRPERVSYSNHIFHQYTIKVEANIRDQLIEYLYKNEVMTMIYYPEPIHNQAAYSHLDRANLDNSEMMSKSVISLPMHPHLTLNEQEYISGLLKAFFTNNL